MSSRGSSSSNESSVRSNQLGSACWPITLSPKMESAIDSCATELETSLDGLSQLVREAPSAVELNSIWGALIGFLSVPAVQAQGRASWRSSRPTAGQTDSSFRPGFGFFPQGHERACGARLSHV